MKNTPSDRHRRAESGVLLGLALIAVLAAAVYAPSLGGPFFLDDITNIVANPSLRMERPSLAALAESTSFVEGAHPNRPVASISFAINYLLGRYDPLGYRLFNLAVLLLSIPFAYLLGRLLCSRWHGEEAGSLLALSATAVWVLHPLLTNGVSYIVQRMTSICALFSLAALYCFFRAAAERRPVWYGAAVLCWAVALGSKETAVLLPLTALLFLWLTEKDAGRRKLYAGLLITAVIAGQAALYLLFRDPLIWELRGFTISERLLTEGRVLLHYLSLFALPLPSRLNLDYDFALSSSLLSPPSTAAALAFHGLLLLGALLASRRRPLFCFGLVSFYLLLLLESTFIPLEIIFEHRVYLPFFFLALACADLLFALLHRVSQRNAAGAVLTVASLWALCLAFLTFERNKVWSDGLTLAADIAAKSPGKARPRHNLGVLLLKDGRRSEALTQLQAALRLDPDDAVIRNSLGNALVEAGEPEAAMEHFRRAAVIDPDNPEYPANLGSLFWREGNLDLAREHLERSLELDPDFPPACNNLGIILAAEGKLRQAAELYRRALESDPGFSDAEYNLGVALARMGRLNEAMNHFLAAVRLEPGHAEARYNLAVVLGALGNRTAAAEQLREVLKRDPMHFRARTQLKGITDPDALE